MGICNHAKLVNTQCYCSSLVSRPPTKHHSCGVIFSHGCKNEILKEDWKQGYYFSASGKYRSTRLLNFLCDVGSTDNGVWNQLCGHLPVVSIVARDLAKL